MEISVLLPASLTADARDLRLKTIKIGLVGRALAIFRVEKIVVYNDDDPRVKDQGVEAELIATILRYIETPQYLRRILFRRARDLRYAGLLHPLRTPHHPLRDERIKPGDCREAVVMRAERDGILLEMGMRERGFTTEKLKVGERVTVRLGERVDRDRIAVSRIERGQVGEYWGYGVSPAKSLADGLKYLKADYRIGTSRRGRNLNEAIRGIERSSPASLAIAFGGPYAGLSEICQRQGVDAEELFDVVVNTIPQQGTATVRTEEALIATLALLNVMIRER